MNGKKGSFEINIPSAIKGKLPEAGKKAGESFSCKNWISNVWGFCKEDSNRVLFSLKVGLAVLLVSLLILFQAPYAVFGTNIIWSILTVAIMFEYTVGATFNRGFNRALGSLLAGILAIIVAQLALCSGRVAEPFIIGISIFLVGAVTSFMKLWPTLVPYEYGFRVILFTFCLIVVSGYRMGNPIKTAMDRLYSIALGGFVAVLVSVLVCPIWAGEQLHKELVDSFTAVADSLEECVKKYLEDEGIEHPEFQTTVMDEFPDEPAYKKCRSTLNSSAKLESLASSAKWEPPHGRFRHFFYPWLDYVKVGAVLRYCAYEVMALHGVLHSEIQMICCTAMHVVLYLLIYSITRTCSRIQSMEKTAWPSDSEAPHNLRIIFQSEIREAASQAAELVRALGKDMSNMSQSSKTSLQKSVHSSTEKLQRAIYMHSYLLTSTCEPPPADSFSKPLQNKLSSASSATPNELSSQLENLEENANSGAAVVPLARTESYHETMRKQYSRRNHSWPPRTVDIAVEEEDILPRMNALESTAALSLATFTSLLIEFVARLDHLVEAVEKVSNMADFDQA